LVTVAALDAVDQRQGACALAQPFELTEPNGSGPPESEPLAWVTWL
jgi:hypothetical protein